MAFDPISIGLGALAIGSKLFGTSPEEQYQKRKKEAQDALRRSYERKIHVGAPIIQRGTADLIAQGSQGGIEQAVAAGRPEAADAFIQPLVSKISGQGSDTLRRFISDAGSQYEDSLTNLELNGLNQPVSPNAGDVISEIAGLGLRYKQGQDYVSALSQSQPDYSIGNEGPLPEFDPMKTFKEHNDIYGHPDPLEEYAGQPSNLMRLYRRPYYGER